MCGWARSAPTGTGGSPSGTAEDGARTLTPHQVGARLGYGPIPAGATVLHDCEVRLCCRAAPGHLRVGTQSENMRQAVARGRAVGPRPGRVDVRGKAGASRAIQAALLAAADRSPAGLAAVLAAVIAEGDPWRDLLAVVRPARNRIAGAAAVADGRVPRRWGCGRGRVGGCRSDSLPLFDGVAGASPVLAARRASPAAGVARSGVAGRCRRRDRGVGVVAGASRSGCGVSSVDQSRTLAVVAATRRAVAAAGSVGCRHRRLRT